MVSLSCDQRELKFAAGCTDSKLRIFDVEMKACELFVKHVIA